MTKNKRQRSARRPVESVDAACSSERLLTVSEAAEFLSISATKLAELGKEGQIPRVRIGRAVRFDRSDLIALIERRKTRQ